MVARRVEVDVVGDVERHQFGRAGKGQQRLFEPLVCTALDGVEQRTANVRPNLWPGLEEGLEPTPQ